MIRRRILEKVANIFLNEAMNNVDSQCVFWHHQPELPDEVEKIKRVIDMNKKRIVKREVQ